MSVMLYKCPGPHLLHDVECEYVIVDESEVDERVNEGWAFSPLEAENAMLAKKVAKVAKKPATVAKKVAKKKASKKKVAKKVAE